MPKNNKKKTIYPLVSLCTPTFNRRPFIPFMIKCFEHQTYPKDRIEWIIIDDGTDPIKELVEHIPQVKYFYYDEKMVLGKKRNLMHSKCNGDIIVYMDDDDYYPPERISHAVEMLQKNPKCLLAGSSEMHIYFNSINKMYQCGPYSKNHATAATFAFKKQLLSQTSYDTNKAFAEESQFTKQYSIPLIQLDTLKTILVFSHNHNSLNKEKVLQNPQQYKACLSNYTVDHFIKQPELKDFYMNDMNNLIENYEPGRLENKPEILKQLSIQEKEREKRILQQKQSMLSQKSIFDLEKMKNDYEKRISDKNIIINEILKKVKTLTDENEKLKANQNIHTI